MKNLGLNESNIGYGHTHTTEGLKKITPYGEKPNPSAAKFGQPSNTRGLADYKNQIHINDDYRDRDKNAHVQFIASPKGYTIYSSARKTPKNSSHNG